MGLLNAIHQNVKVGMETENRDLFYLDALVTRRFDSTPGHAVYKRPTHMDFYLLTKHRKGLCTSHASLTG